MGATVVGELTIEITKLKAQLAAANAAVRRSMKEGEKEGAGLGHALAAGVEKSGFKEVLMGAIGGGAVAGAAEVLKGVIEEYGHLYDAALKLNVGTDSIQRMAIMAKLAGTDVNSMVSALNKLAIKLEDTGDDKVRKALDELKISPGDLVGIDPLDQIKKLSEASNEAIKSGRGNAATKDLLGKGFQELLPLIREHHEIAEAADSVEILGPKAMKNIDDFGDKLDLAIIKLKAFYAANAVSAAEHPIDFAWKVNPIAEVKGAIDAMRGKASDAPLAMALRAIGVAPKVAETPETKAESDKAKKAAADEALDKEISAKRASIEASHERLEPAQDKLRDILDKFESDTGTSPRSITTANQMLDVLRQIQADADKAHAAGDKSGERDHLKKLVNAQGDAEAFLKQNAPETKSPMGSLGGDINRLLGKSGSEMVSDKVAEGNTILGRIEQRLSALNKTGNAPTQSIWINRDGGPVFGQ